MPSHHAVLGFTLIELMVTLSVAGVLLGIAIPSFMEMSVRNRLSMLSNDLVSSVNYARSEAVRLSAPISICKSNDGTSCSGSWNDGWIIFVNSNGDSPAVVDDPDDEPVLKVYGAVPAGYTLGTDASFDTDITYGRDGAATATGVIAVCYDDELVGSRAVAVGRLRPRMASDTDADRIPNKDDGGNVADCAAP